MACHKLPKQHRLLRQSDYARVFKYRRHVRVGNFEAATAPNDLEHPRLGLAVSRRVSTKATARNRLKRLIRESFRLRMPHIEGTDVVIVALPGADCLGPGEVLKMLDNIWISLEKICADSH